MRKNVLKQSESEIAENDKQIKQEIDDLLYHHHSHKQMKTQCVINGGYYDRRSKNFY